MFVSKTLLMTAAVLAIGFTGSAQAAGLLNATNGVSVNTPVANVGANTNVNTGVSTNEYRGHTSAGVNADGSVNSRTTERSTTTDTSGTVTTGQRIRTSHTSGARTDANVDTNVYSEESARNEQMREDMSNNDSVHAGARVRTGTSLGFNE